MKDLFAQAGVSTADGSQVSVKWISASRAVFEWRTCRGAVGVRRAPEDVPQVVTW